MRWQGRKEGKVEVDGKKEGRKKRTRKEKKGIEKKREIQKKRRKEKGEREKEIEKKIKFKKFKKIFKKTLRQRVKLINMSSRSGQHLLNITNFVVLLHELFIHYRNLLIFGFLL